jgi:hypothetical protein
VVSSTAAPSTHERSDRLHVDIQIEDRFERGLDWLLDGFAAKIGR